jgi:hypothetical protein
MNIILDSLLLSRLGLDFEEFVEICEKIWGYTPETFSSFDILAIWQMAGYLDLVRPEMSSYIERMIQSMGTQDRKAAIWLKTAVIGELALIMRVRESEHGKIHSWFKKSHKSVIPDSKLIKVQSRDRKRPDFLVEVNGSIYPVECKLTFHRYNIKQLHGYMNLWDVSIGYAVAAKLTCELPPNIIFVSSH